MVKILSVFITVSFDFQVVLFDLIRRVALDRFQEQPHPFSQLESGKGFQCCVGLSREWHAGSSECNARPRSGVAPSTFSV